MLPPGPAAPNGMYTILSADGVSMFTIHTNPQPWEGAEAACVAADGHLWVPDDSEEWAYVMPHVLELWKLAFPDVGANIGTFQQWDMFLGISYENSGWRTVTGDPYPAANQSWGTPASPPWWAGHHSQPDAAAQGSCGVLWNGFDGPGIYDRPTIQDSTALYLADWPCDDTTLPFICKSSRWVPAGSSLMPRTRLQVIACQLAAGLPACLFTLDCLPACA